MFVGTMVVKRFFAHICSKQDFNRGCYLDFTRTSD